MVSYLLAREHGDVTEGGCSSHRVTEPVLQRLLDVLTELEAGLAEQRSRSQGTLTYTRAE
ncbi:hypothetical protein AB0L35_08465 [Streptomyces sp. NPDC052309]|uniref:Uncharacterized protein n=1 Tax=Streptomyces griseicoloratus TaxID=2752516 RepID=A0A926L971_9ACTN|nr:hypothetical protein [Streptomyces griseicoloratus]MBD0423719.1 hypothetical protein [Streptomyces griseicoloratus]